MTIAVIVAMYAAFLVVGWLAARKVKDGSAADLIIAGRSMPLLLATLTMTATWVDGGYLLGTSEGVYRSSIASGLQGGVCFGISLILGGIFFARRMRALQFTTLIDPFEARFGKRWAVVLFLPALAGEIFWSAELLVAIGSTFGAMLGMQLATAIVISAIVVIAYTMVGGMWSVAYTDAFQLGLVVFGVLIAIPFALQSAGGFSAAFDLYLTSRSDRGGVIPPFETTAFWSKAAVINWWDVSLMLVLGGIPWNCYFQRVLACRTPSRAVWHSILAGLLTIALTVPPLLLGIAAFSYAWPTELKGVLEATPSLTLPMLLKHMVPPVVGLIGFGAIIGAVTSSFSSSILSAASMISWNGVKRLLVPQLTVVQMKRLIRGSVVVLGACAVIMSLKVQSVQALWFFTSDLVFVLLFPQLVCALYDSKVNRIGSIVAFCISLVLRLGGGEPLLGIGHFIPYPEMWSALSGGDAQQWYGDGGVMLFPFKTLAAGVGMILLPVVSRLSVRYDSPRELSELSETGV